MKYTFLLLLTNIFSIFFCNCTFSQEMYKVWDKRFGGTDVDYLNTIIAISDGGYLLGGLSRSGANGDKSQSSQGADDFWIVKIDNIGNKVWDKRFGGTNTDELNTIIATSDGGYLLGGTSYSGANGDKSQTSQGYYDFWIVKIDNIGNKVWDKRFGGIEADLLNTIIATSDGGYLLGGYSDSGANGDKSQTSQGYQDFWIVKIDNIGNKVWDKRFGGTNTDDLSKIIATSDGGYLLGGSSYSGANGDKSQGSQGFSDFWIVKIDNIGNKVWDKRFGGTDFDYLSKIIATSDGGYLLGGHSFSGANGDKSQGSQGSIDFWIVKIDNIGNKVWDKRFGGTEGDLLNTIIATPDGGYLLGGYSDSGANGDKSQGSQGSTDFWIVKIDNIGNKVWDKRFGGTDFDYLSKIIATSDGGYLLGGSSYSGANGDKSQTSQGNSDYWIIKLEGGCNLTASISPNTSQNICSGNTLSLTGSSTGGTIPTYAWSSSPSGFTSNQQNPSFTPIASSSSNYTITLTVTDGTCTATSTLAITVNPNPTVSVNNQTICSGSNTSLTASNCTGNISWNTGATGSVLSISNLTTTSNYTATCTLNSCTATSTGTVTVNQLPTVNTITNQQFSAGNNTSVITFTGSIPNTIYNWTNDNPSIGLAANGTGNIPTFVAVNSGTTPQVANITVTPSTSSPNCSGTSKTFSITVTRAVSGTITKMEYFIDADPGYGNGVNIAYTEPTPGVTIADFGVSLPDGVIGNGFHFLNIRAKDANNNWSIVAVRPFYKETLPTGILPNITAMEYFIDNDTGFGNNTAVKGLTAEINMNSSFTVTLGSLTNGSHKLYLRAKDTNNQWSIVGVSSFVVQDNIIIVGIIPTQWCANTPFNVPFTLIGTYTAGNIFTVQLSDMNGSFTSPTTIGTLTSVVAGTISSTVPNGTSLSNNYQIRVISSTPSITNTDGKPFQLISVCPPPCAGLLTLAHPADDILSSNIIKQASAANGSISASNYVQGSGTRATYQAKSITLSTGFRAENGAVFKAEIGGCNN